MAFNLGRKADFTNFFNQLDCGKVILIKQPYMKVNKQGNFILRNDILSNLEIEKGASLEYAQELAYEEAEIFYQNELYRCSEAIIQDGYKYVKNALKAVGPFSWWNIRQRIKLPDKSTDLNKDDKFILDQVIKQLNRKDKLEFLDKLKEIHTIQHRSLVQNKLDVIDEQEQMEGALNYIEALDIFSRGDPIGAYFVLCRLLHIMPGNDQALMLQAKCLAVCT